MVNNKLKEYGSCKSASVQERTSAGDHQEAYGRKTPKHGLIRPILWIVGHHPEHYAWYNPDNTHQKKCTVQLWWQYEAVGMLLCSRTRKAY